MRISNLVHSAKEPLARLRISWVMPIILSMLAPFFAELPGINGEIWAAWPRVVHQDQCGACFYIVRVNAGGLIKRSANPI
jgi:hypothetical protein